MTAVENHREADEVAGEEEEVASVEVVVVVVDVATPDEATVEEEEEEKVFHLDLRFSSRRRRPAPAFRRDFKIGVDSDSTTFPASSLSSSARAPVEAALASAGGGG